MRGHLFGLSLKFGSRRSLSTRGHFLSTFAGIGFSLAFALLALGAYLIEQQFAHPIEAQPVDLLVAALLITTALALLISLLGQTRNFRHRSAASPTPVSWEEKKIAGAKSSSPSSEEQKDVPLHVRYVDRLDIRIPRSADQARGIAGK